jgi:hypothetical protein
MIDDPALSDLPSVGSLDLLDTWDAGASFRVYVLVVCTCHACTKYKVRWNVADTFATSVKLSTTWLLAHEVIFIDGSEMWPIEHDIVEVACDWTCCSGGSDVLEKGV